MTVTPNNNSLPAFDDANLFLNPEHFIYKQNRYSDLADKIKYHLYNNTPNRNVKIYQVLVYEQLTEDSSRKKLVPKLLVVANDEDYKHYKLYNVNYDVHSVIKNYTSIELENKDDILLDALEVITIRYGIVPILEFTKENKCCLSLLDGSGNFGFKLNYTTVKDKDGITVETNLLAYNRKDESEIINTNSVLQGFCVRSETLTGMVDTPAFNDILVGEVVKGILLLIYGLFDTYIKLSNFVIGSSKDKYSNDVDFFINYNIEQTLEGNYSGSGKIKINRTGHKTISFTVNKRNKEQLLNMIQAFGSLRDRLTDNSYGYNPVKLDRDIEDKIIKDFSKIVDIVDVVHTL